MTNKDTVWAGWDQLSPLLRLGNFWDGAPAHGFGPRYVQDFQILMINAGCGEAMVNGQSFSVTAGDLIFYGPHELHAVQSSYRMPLRLIGLHFLFQQEDLPRLDLSLSFASPTLYEYPLGELHVPLEPRPPSKSSPGTASSALRSCESLVLSYMTDPNGRLLEKRGLLLMLFENWHDTILNEVTQSTLSPMYSRIVDQAQQAILENLKDPPEIETLCRDCHISIRYFSRIFKACTGMGIRQYTLHHRLLWARRLLVTGKLNVSEVAATVGFDDPHYFSRCFVKRFGIAPSVVRSDSQLA